MLEEKNTSPSSEDIQKYRDLLVGTADHPKCRDSFVLGEPTGIIRSDGKVECSYFNPLPKNPNRRVTDSDIFNDLVGKKRLVLSPHLPDNTCYGFTIDNDEQLFKDFTVPDWAAEILNVYPSKSKKTHIKGFLREAESVALVVRFMEVVTRKLGWSWPIETFPDHRQVESPPVHCTCVNSPFFGMRHVPPVRYCPPILDFLSDTDSTSATRHVKPERTSDTPSAEDESGDWWDEPLVALLTAYKDFYPGFEFKKYGSFYEVPCPGNRKLGGWLDGNMHSDDNEPLLSDKTVVFIRNGYPKFKCMHAHCDGKFGEKRTINDWRKYFDPGYVFFDIDHWLDECAIANSRPKGCR
jgi:hypothetical protein